MKKSDKHIMLLGNDQPDTKLINTLLPNNDQPDTKLINTLLPNNDQPNTKLINTLLPNDHHIPIISPFDLDKQIKNDLFEHKSEFRDTDITIPTIEIFTKMED